MAVKGPLRRPRRLDAVPSHDAVLRPERSASPQRPARVAAALDPPPTLGVGAKHPRSPDSGTRCLPLVAGPTMSATPTAEPASKLKTRAGPFRLTISLENAAVYRLSIFGLGGLGSLQGDNILVRRLVGERCMGTRWSSPRRTAKSGFFPRGGGAARLRNLAATVTYPTGHCRIEHLQLRRLRGCDQFPSIEWAARATALVAARSPTPRW